MRREIKLDGGEITVVKALGLSGTPVHGKMLLERVSEMAEAEFLETLNGLLDLGYILSNKVNVTNMEDVERAYFRTNPSYARDLREALNPSRHRPERKRQRRR